MKEHYENRVKYSLTGSTSVPWLTNEQYANMTPLERARTACRDLTLAEKFTLLQELIQSVEGFNL